jgi:hypothetical protein
MSDRRPAFFGVAAVLCFVLVPVAHADFRAFAVTLGSVYVVLALLSLLDGFSRSHQKRG